MPYKGTTFIIFEEKINFKKFKIQLFLSIDNISKIHEFRRIFKK